MTGEGSKFVAKSNTTTHAWSTDPMMYIDMTEGTNNPVGFIHDNETLPSGASTVGFGLYGGWAFHKQGDSEIEMKFLAAPTNETGIYLLVIQGFFLIKLTSCRVKWNAASTTTSNDIPISLRTQVPVALGSN